MRTTPHSPTGRFHPVLTVFCNLYVASLICLAAVVTAADFLAGKFKRLKQLRGEGRQLPSRLLGPQTHGPHVEASGGGQQRPGEHEGLQRAAQASGYRGDLDSPSWRTTRLCG